MGEGTEVSDDETKERVAMYCYPFVCYVCDFGSSGEQMNTGVRGGLLYNRARR